MPMKSLRMVWSKIRHLAHEDEGEPNGVAVIIFAAIMLLSGGTIVVLLTLLNSCRRISTRHVS